jgi:uncharacterized protein (TIGR00255 family)
MVRSMTGFGTATFQGGDAAVTVEVRTVNHRFLDLHVRVPREYGSVEAEIHQCVRSLLTRGRVDINVNIQGSSRAEMLLDHEVARNYLRAASKLKEEFHLEDSIDLRTLLSLPGVFRGKDGADDEKPISDDLFKASVLQVLREALDGVLRMRAREGEALGKDLAQHLENLRIRLEEVRKLAPTLALEYQQRLQERLAQLLPQTGLDATRLAQEVALLAEKTDISEELNRLESHLEQFSGWLDSKQEVGKKMDFLLQEMQREINTMLAKTSNMEVTRSAIAMKADIEKLREQVQNVE